jgi:hypothetical protein
VIEQRSTKAATNLASIFFYLVPEGGPNGTGIPQGSLHRLGLNTNELFLPVNVNLDPTLQQTPKVLRNVDVLGQVTTADMFVGLDPSKSVIVVVQTTAMTPLQLWSALFTSNI